jgi:hypothetical protein
MGDISDFERRQIVGERLAGACVTKIAILLGVSRATVFKGYFGIHESWGDNIDTKRSSYIEKDCFRKITELMQHM